MMVADLGELFPAGELRQVDTCIFLSQSGVLPSFYSFCTVYCTGGVVYPNVVLIYKGDSDDVS